MVIADPSSEFGRRPAGVCDDTVEAVGAVSEGLECVERARGHLYSFHQLMGHADLQLGEACDKLRDPGHDIRHQLQQGQRHVFEAEMKERRRTHDHPGHEPRP